MKNVLIFLSILSIICISFASTLVVYNNGGMYTSSKKVNGSFTIVVPNSIIKNSFYCTPFSTLDFVPQRSITIESILDSNPYITLNKNLLTGDKVLTKYKVISVNPIVLQLEERYFYNVDINGFGFDNLPKIVLASFEGYTDKATTLNYSYLFGGISWSLKYFFDSGDITAIATIKNDTNNTFSADTYLISQLINNRLLYQNNATRSFTVSVSKSLTTSKARQKLGDRYVYNVGDLLLKKGEQKSFVLFKTHTYYSSYYGYYPSPNITNLRRIIYFRAPIDLPKGVWTVVEKNKDLSVFSPDFWNDDAAAGARVYLEYDYSYKLSGYESMVESWREGKYLYKKFDVMIYNSKDEMTTVKIYKTLGNATIYKFNGGYDLTQGYAIFTIKIKPKSRGELVYTLRYPY